ncbi:MAG: 3-dehydroquinate synthase [Planctomycetota bacterium]|nr:MAG: 3-dehydroquinate synthase [Planctomycetota bacterium]
MRVHLPAVVAAPPGDAAAVTDRSYDIVCGRGILASSGACLRSAAARRAIVIADAAVAATHAATVAEAIRAVGIDVTALTVASGEASKSAAEAERLWNEFGRLAVDRGTHVVAVGGGVVGDLVGFVAATFARGLALWQVPTTLVAQVDSAIGGKTGINLAAGKNLVGAFWQPRGVLADIDTLVTLPDREFVSGIAEIIKYGMILDADFFAWLEQHAAALLAREPQALALAVERSAAIKAGVVERDEREISGLRAALNYGHTFAHAYETASGYGKLLHGEAVAIGMALAARLAAALGRIPQDLVARQDRLIEAFGLPVDPRVAGSFDSELLLAIMGRDKKTLDGRLRFVLPSRLGSVDVVDGVAADVVRRILAG